jgi:hypothetical protein
MKLGDIVKLAATVTRKGCAHESQVGIVIELVIEDNLKKAVVNFAGTLLTYPQSYLRIINERG